MKRKKIEFPPVNDNQVIHDVQLDWPVENNLSERMRVHITDENTNNPIYNVDYCASFDIIAIPLDIEPKHEK